MADFLAEGLFYACGGVGALDRVPAVLVLVMV